MEWHLIYLDKYNIYNFRNKTKNDRIGQAHESLNPPNKTANLSALIDLDWLRHLNCDISIIP